jgi:hypothetical protein
MHKTPKKLLEGGKFASSHSTIIPDAVKIIRAAKTFQAREVEGKLRGLWEARGK